MHTNSITGKSYIGFTSSTMEERWQQHVYGARLSKKSTSRKFWNSLRKHGYECWTHKILTTCSTPDEAKNTERLLIEQYDTYNRGYNSTKGGDGLNGHSHSPETRAKIGDIGRGAKRSATFKENVRQHMKRIHRTRKYKEYVVSAPDGTMTYTTNLKQFCAENGLKPENLRWTLKTGKPCPFVHAGWQVKYA